MVAAVLADTKNLLRVVVPKALLLQTAQLLQARLGGLLGREVRLCSVFAQDSDQFRKHQGILQYP